MGSIIHIDKVGFIHPDVNETDEDILGNEQATLYLMDSQYAIIDEVSPKDDWTRQLIYKAVHERAWLIATMAHVEIFLGSTWIGSTDVKPMKVSIGLMTI